MRSCIFFAAPARHFGLADGRFLPVVSLVLLFVSYLSLTIAGQTFLSFQWDILLLETGFLAIFFAPVRWRMRRDSDAPVSRVGHFLLKLLLFKLMLMSGVVKLTSGDDSWWNLTALDYHYWTQPLPTVLGWWADQEPGMVQAFLGRVLVSSSRSSSRFSSGRRGGCGYSPARCSSCSRS